MNLGFLISIFVCVLSFYFALPPAKQEFESKSPSSSKKQANIPYILEQLQDRAKVHHLQLIAFNPVFERGDSVFSLRIDAKFSNFYSWYVDVLENIPKIKWRYLRLKPKPHGMIVVLEGSYVE